MHLSRVISLPALLVMTSLSLTACKGGDDEEPTDDSRTEGDADADADADSDTDADGEEVFEESTDPLNPDTDGDGLVDGEEVLTEGTDPLDTDSDDDGLDDCLLYTSPSPRDRTRSRMPSSA